MNSTALFSTTGIIIVFREEEITLWIEEVWLPVCGEFAHISWTIRINSSWSWFILPLRVSFSWLADRAVTLITNTALICIPPMSKNVLDSNFRLNLHVIPVSVCGSYRLPQPTSTKESCQFLTVNMSVDFCLPPLVSSHDLLRLSPRVSPGTCFMWPCRP